MGFTFRKSKENAPDEKMDSYRGRKTKTDRMKGVHNKGKSKGKLEAGYLRERPLPQKIPVKKSIITVLLRKKKVCSLKSQRKRTGRDV